MNKLKIFNQFGINPTTNFTAAGLDFYIPNLQMEKPEDREDIWNEFAKSFKTDVETLKAIGNRLVMEVTADSNLPEAFIYSNILNLVHLYCALNPGIYEDEFGVSHKYNLDFFDNIAGDFVEYYLIVPEDENGVFGISCGQSDSVLFNSGIRVALPKDTAGIFFNKSGKGNAGFDVRACVVDVDYAGLVHMSLQYTNSDISTGRLWVGDKLVQMVIVPIYQTDGVENLTKEDYDKMMQDSLRGSDGFGSSDVKH